MITERLTSEAMLRKAAELYWVPCEGSVCRQNREVAAHGLPAIDGLDECQGTGRVYPWRQPCPRIKGYVRGHLHRKKPDDCLVCGGTCWVPGVLQDGLVRDIHLEDVFVACPLLYVRRRSWGSEPDDYCAGISASSSFQRVASTPLNAALQTFVAWLETSRETIAPS